MAQLTGFPIERSFFEGGKGLTDPEGLRAILTEVDEALDAAASLDTNVVYVDPERSSLAQATGSALYPLLSFQDGVLASPKRTTQLGYATTNILKLSPTTYDEEITIEVERNITIISDGIWDLGEFSAFGGSQSGTRRNITLVGDGTGINAVIPRFNILSPGAASRITGKIPRISGQIISNVINAGVPINVAAHIWGSNSNASGTSVDLTGGAGGNVVFQPGCILRGGIDMPGGLIWFFDSEVIADTINMGGIVLAQNTRFDVADMNLDGTFDATSFGDPAGFVDCGFARPMNYNWLAGAVTPFGPDAYTNFRSKEVSSLVTRTGGATKIIRADVTA